MDISSCSQVVLSCSPAINVLCICYLNALNHWNKFIVSWSKLLAVFEVMDSCLMKSQLPSKQSSITSSTIRRKLFVFIVFSTWCDIYWKIMSDMVSDCWHLWHHVIISMDKDFHCHRIGHHHCTEIAGMKKVHSASCFLEMNEPYLLVLNPKTLSYTTMSRKCRWDTEY